MFTTHTVTGHVSRLNPVYTFTHYVVEIHFNIDQDSVCISNHLHATCPVHLILLSRLHQVVTLATWRFKSQLGDQLPWCLLWFFSVSHECCDSTWKWAITTYPQFLTSSPNVIILSHYSVLNNWLSIQLVSSSSVNPISAEFKLWSASLHNFLCPPITSPLLGPITQLFEHPQIMFFPLGVGPCFTPT